VTVKTRLDKAVVDHARTRLGSKGGDVTDERPDHPLPVGIEAGRQLSSDKRAAAHVQGFLNGA
jgi:hypothetical protein